ncbi:MAG TPA: hypothetical protein VFQ07_11340 [Candidatus Polarisedimenticolia bacterium]|nr:hypothetical protein [Candidatus Polarisedimenticolia bacterium]
MGRVVPVVAALLLGFGSERVARAEILYNPQGWKFPNIVTAAKEAIHVSDRTTEIPGKETLNKGYRRTNGTRVMTYEIEGKIFGVDIDEDGKPPFEYGIMDADGDGKFETKIVYSKENKDHFYVPAWVIDFYFKAHPDVQRGPGGNPAMPSLNAAAAAPGAPPAPGKKGAAPPKKKVPTPTTSPTELANP